MVIDSSALLAILLGEPEGEAFAAAILEDPVCLMSSANLLEAALVVESRLGEAGARELDLLVYRLGIEVTYFDSEQLSESRRAWRRYGKGNDPAGLNLGDLFAYGLASISDEPLLFKGDDFAATDLTPVGPSG